MDTQKSQKNLIYGILVIGAGILLLLNNVLSSALMSQVWIVALAVAAAVLAYIYSRSQETWAAVGAYISGAIAFVAFITSQTIIAGVWTPVIVLALIGLPFLYAGLRNAHERGLLIPAYVMFAIALFLVVTTTGSNQMAGEFVPVYVMAAIALPFIIAAFMTRNYSLLIPAAILLLIGLFLLSEVIGISTQIFTIGVPALLIGLGVLILLRLGVRDDHTKQKQS